MKRFHDWYKLQKDAQVWDEIVADQKIIDLISKQTWSLDLTWCHDNLKSKLLKYHVEKDQPDFFVITNIELSKMPLESIVRLVQTMYSKAQVGGYVALLSYYLNSQKTHEGLTEIYSKNIDIVLRRYFDFVHQIDDHSHVTDYPILVTKDNQLVEGANFIFVHPNVRYMLWK